MVAQRFYAERAMRANALGQSIGSGLAQAGTDAKDVQQLAAAFEARSWSLSPQIAGSLDGLAREGD